MSWLPVIAFAGFGSFCFSLGYILCGVMSANTRAEELEAFGDDCYADGYEQRVQEEQAGIQRLPTHRP